MPPVYISFMTMALKSNAEFLEAASKSRLLHEAQRDYAESSKLLQDQKFETEQQLIRCLQSVDSEITRLVIESPSTAGLERPSINLREDWKIPLTESESALDRVDTFFNEYPEFRERYGVIASDARRVIGFLCGCHGIPAKGDDTVE